jgi:hypothetical protein
MKKILFLISLALCLSASIKAQKNDTLDVQDKEYQENIEELLFVSGNKTSMNSLFPLIMNMLKDAIPNVPANVMTMIENKYKDLFINKVAQFYTPIYKRYLSLEDLKGFIAFYKTPLGQKVAMATPTMNKELMEAGQEVSKSIVKDIVEELGKEGYSPNKM